MRKSLIIAMIFLGMFVLTPHVSNCVKAEVAPTHKTTCKELIDCIIEISDNILNSLHQSERDFSSSNQKLVYQLAKQCWATKTKIVSMVGAIAEEARLRPNKEIVKDYFVGRLTSGTLKNGTLSEETVELESEEFKAKLYVEGYKEGIDLKTLSIVSTDNDGNFQPGNALEGLRSEWTKMSGRAKPESWWFTKEGAFYSYGFFQRIGGKVINGLVILEKKLDYHTILNECAE